VDWGLCGPEAIAEFEAGRVSAQEFRHRDHLRLAWHYLNAFGLDETLQRFPKQIKAFANRVGAPGLYHQTITWAYLFAIHERMQGREWDRFEEENPDLFGSPKRWLGRYYSQARLSSNRAREVFLLPDQIRAELVEPDVEPERVDRLGTPGESESVGMDRVASPE